MIIRNNGPLILESDFWESEFERDGILFLSTNARAFRLLLPRQWEPEIKDLSTGKLAVISRPRNPCRFALEIMLDDGSENPYCLHLSAQQLDVVPAKEDDGREDLEFTVWTQPRRGVPHLALRRPAAYRSVPSLPCLKPWKRK